MEISVIIPSYKPKDYLWQCLESLNIQTLSKDNFEIILILNGCKNPWYKQIQKWISNHPDLNFNFIQTDTPGVSNARNIGLENAKGEYITFIDDDDYVSPTYLYALLTVSKPESVALSNSLCFDDKNGNIKADDIYHKGYLDYSHLHDSSFYQVRRFFNGPWMKLLDRKCIGDIRFNIYLEVGEDSLFMFAISKNIKYINFSTKDAIYYHRYRQNSAFTTTRPTSFWLKNCLKIQTLTIKYWIKSPFRYNFKFTISRLLAPLKTILVHS